MPMSRDQFISRIYLTGFTAIAARRGNYATPPEGDLLYAVAAMLADFVDGAHAGDYQLGFVDSGEVTSPGPKVV